MNHGHVTVDDWKGINRFWNADTGYGFPCEAIVKSPLATPYMAPFGQPFAPHPSSILLLKLHGSMNWRVRLGAPPPYDIRSIVHLEDWNDPLVRIPEDAEAYLEPTPFLVPPVLVKSDLVEQPILRLIWSKAYETLSQAEEVVFIGYSFPITDVASIHLFSESIKCPVSNIHVVDYAATSDQKTKNRVVQAYQRVFPDLRESQFDFRGALEWCKEAIQRDPSTPVPHPA